MIVSNIDVHLGGLVDKFFNWEVDQILFFRMALVVKPRSVVSMCAPSPVSDAPALYILKHLSASVDLQLLSVTG